VAATASAQLLYLHLHLRQVLLGRHHQQHQGMGRQHRLEARLVAALGSWQQQYKP
jgi:hypothetical protein